MNRFRVAAPIGLALCLAGCVIPIPPSGRHISQKELEEVITVGSSTKAELLERLRERQARVVLQEGRFVLVAGSRSSGGLLVIVPGEYTAGAMGGSFGETNYRILFEFDDKDIVRRYEIEESPEAKPGVPQAVAARKTLIERRPQLELRNLGERGYLSVAFSPDGKMVAAGDGENRVLLWNLDRGSQPVIFQGEREGCLGAKRPSVYSVSFSRDGRTLAAGGFEGIARLWDAASGKEVVSFEGHGTPGCWRSYTQRVFSLAFAPDGRHVATVGMQPSRPFRVVVKIWDTSTGREFMTLAPATDSWWGGSVAFSPDGTRLATTTVDGRVTLWELATGKELASQRREGHGAPNVAFSPDGNLLAINRGDRVEVRRLTSAKPLDELERVFILPNFGFCFRAYTPNARGTCSVAFSTDGHRLVAGNQAAVMWDVATSRQLWRFIPSQPMESVFDVAFSPDGTLLATAGSGGVHLWDVQPQEDGAAR